jgi:SnoaL-like protein
VIDAVVAGDAIHAFCVERDPCTIAHGRTEVEAMLVGERPEILVRAEAGQDVLIEGRLPDATAAASFQLDGDGAIVRGLAFRTRPIESPRSSGPNGHDARSVLDAYFERLEAGEFAAAADCFSEDALYSHPPYAAGGERVDVHGRKALRALFEERGRQPWRHRILVAIQVGADCLLEGDVHGLGSFISSVSLAGDGHICRYVSFYTEPAVPRR